MLKPILLALALAGTAMIVPEIAGMSAAYAWTEGDGGDAGEPSSTPPPSQPELPGSPGGSAGDLPPLPPTEQIARMENVCNTGLSALAHVTAKMVEAIAPTASVNIVGVCNSGLGHQAPIDADQALPVRDAIAANPLLAAALQTHGFHADEVVGIVIAGGKVTLYVHRAAA